jgi:hypothetical protein
MRVWREENIALNEKMVFGAHGAGGRGAPPSMGAGWAARRRRGGQLSTGQNRGTSVQEATGRAAGMRRKNRPRASSWGGMRQVQVQCDSCLPFRGGGGIYEV